jgi:hypothetical protein
MPKVIVPWKAIDAFVEADRQFVIAVRNVAARLQVVSHRHADLQDWLVLRGPVIERYHQQLLVAERELHSPAPEQSLDWLLFRVHAITGSRQGLGADYSPNWNPRVSELLDAAVPGKIVNLKQAVSDVRAAGLQLNIACNECRGERQDDPSIGREIYTENQHWFWELRLESGNWDYHLWNGVEVPIDAPTRAAATYFAGVSEGCMLPFSTPVTLRESNGTRVVDFVYESLRGDPEERRRQFSEALDQSGQARIVLGSELYRGRLPLLSRDEGIYGAWHLTDQQYAELQHLCATHNWPMDLWIK